MASLRHLLNDEGESNAVAVDVGIGRIALAGADSAALSPPSVAAAAAPHHAALVPPLAAMDDAVRAQSRSALHTNARPPTAQSAGSSPRTNAHSAPLLVAAELFHSVALVDVADANPLKRASHDRVLTDVVSAFFFFFFFFLFFSFFCACFCCVFADLRLCRVCVCF
jgi:hypothetical protein